MNMFALPRALLTHIPSFIIRYEGIRSPQNIIHIHHTNDVMLIGQDEQEGANMLQAQDSFSYSLGFSKSLLFNANSFICLFKNLVLLIILSLSCIFNILSNSSFLSIFDALHWNKLWQPFLYPKFPSILVSTPLSYPTL